MNLFYKLKLYSYTNFMEYNKVKINFEQIYESKKKINLKLWLKENESSIETNFVSFKIKAGN